jgi:nucleoside-diphosphate-sugar epimerase
MRELVVIIGCGYLGRRLGGELLRAGYRVRGMTRSAEHAKAIAALGIDPLVADVTAPDTLPPALAGAGVVYHMLGGMRGTAEELRRLHVEGTRCVLEALPPSTRRYIYVSSTAVYGQTDGRWVDEASPTEPSSNLGRLRVEAEALARAADGRNGLETVILRPSSIYRPAGPLYRQIREGSYKVSSDPGKWMNHIYIEDFLAAMVLAAERGVGGEAYNLTDDEPHPAGDYFAFIADVMGVPRPPVTYEPPKEGCAVLVRESDKRVGNARIRAHLAWAPKFPSYREGIRDAAARGWRE